MNAKIVKVRKNIVKGSFDYFIADTFELLGGIYQKRDEDNFRAWYEYESGEDITFDEGVFPSLKDAAECVENGIKERFEQRGIVVRFDAY